MHRSKAERGKLGSGYIDIAERVEIFVDTGGDIWLCVIRKAAISELFPR